MPICISGMHRSGTSMVAKVLMDAGLDLGPAPDIMQAAEENPEGFWENLNFVAINDALLAQLGGAWDLPPPPPADWAGPELAGLHEAATRLAITFSGHVPWGWKDPRNCLTIPFWEAVAGPLRHVFVVRNPLEVARSLQKRNSFSPALGLSIWRTYTEGFLADTAREHRIMTHFDAYFGDADQEVERVLAFAGLAHDGATVARVARNASPGLKHHRLALADLLDANVAPEIINLYVDLCAEAGYEQALGGFGLGRETAGLRSMTFRPDRPQTEVGRFGLWFFTQLQRMRDLEAAVSLHELAREELEGRIRERDGMVSERETRISDRDARVIERDRTIARQQRELTMLRETIEDQDRQIAAQTEQIVSLNRHEAELREMLAADHELLLLHDAEVMGTLGGALARVAPGAPAAIYYRQLLDRVRSLALAHIPPGSTALVANYGDEEFLRLNDRAAVPFPQGDGGIAADYTSPNDRAAIDQLESLRAGGAQFLIVPSPAQAWLARLPALGKHLDRHYPAIFHEVGVCTIYGLDGGAG